MKMFPLFFGINFRSNDCNKILSKTCVYLILISIYGRLDSWKLKIVREKLVFNCNRKYNQNGIFE